MEALRVGVADGNATFHSLADCLLAKMGNPAAGTAEGRRDSLRKVLRFSPLRVEQAERAGSHERTGVRTVWYRLRAGEWTVPAALFERAGATPVGTAIVLCDRGKDRLSNVVCEQFEAGRRVLAIDPLFMGECGELRHRPHQFAMMFGTVGKRSLGIQAAQILAVVQWARDEFGAPVSLVAQEWNASVAALAAGALAEPGRFESISCREAPATLRRLIQDRMAYRDAPPLFCFGLLPEFDVPQLRDLCTPAKIEFTPGEHRPR